MFTKIYIILNTAIISATANTQTPRCASAHHSDPMMTNLVAPRRMMAFVTFFFVSYVHENRAQETHTPQVWKSSQVDFKLGKQNLTFKRLGNLFHNKDHAHLFTNLNYTRTLLEYNRLIHVLDIYLEKGQNRAPNGSFHSFNTLISKCRNTQETFEFVCSLIGCKYPVAKSKKVPPPLQLESAMDIYDFASNLARKSFDMREPGGGGDGSAAPHEQAALHLVARRQAVLAATLLGAASFGVSLFSTEEISSLQNDLQKDESKIQLISSELHNRDLAISTLSDRTFTLRRRLNSLIRKEKEDEFLSEVNSLLDHFSVALDNVYIYAMALSQMIVSKKFQPRFFLKESLIKGIRKVKKQASKAGLRLVDDTFLELLSQPISFNSDGTTLFLAIHIGLRSERKYQRYELVDFPLITPDGSRLELVENKNTLILDSSMSEHLVLSESELNQCTKRGKDRICPNFVTYKSLRETCLGSLFIADHDFIGQNCKFKKVNPLRESVHRINEAEVIVFSPPHTRTPVFISCHEENASTQVLVQGLEHFHLKRGCEMSTPHFLFKATAQLGIAAQFVTRKLISMENIRFAIESNPVAEIDQFKPIPRENPIPHTLSHHTHILYIVALTLVSVLAGSLLYCRARRAYVLRHTDTQAHENVELRGRRGPSAASDVFRSINDGDTVRGSPTISWTKNRLARWWPFTTSNDARRCLRSATASPSPGGEGLLSSIRQARLEEAVEEIE